jgi:hypothetical protein
MDPFCTTAHVVARARAQTHFNQHLHRLELTPMGQRQRRWAHAWRERMYLAMGSKCVDCGCTDDLTFDVRTPVVEEHHSLEQSVRMSFYIRQYRMGNLCIRCRVCNARKGRKADDMPRPVWSRE